MPQPRRRFLKLGAVAALGGIAGCSTSQDDTGTTPTADGNGAEGESDDDGSDGGSDYGWTAATFDAYWYSLYNMSTNIAMSANGVLFPHNDQQQQTFEKRIEGITTAADADGPPIANPNLNMAAFTEGDPHFTQQPVFENDAGKPDASTLTWDPSHSSGVVSPASLAWTHLKGVTWAKNFEQHADILPDTVAPKFRAQVLTTLAQIGVKAALVDGTLRKNDDDMLLVSAFRPSDGSVVDATPRVRHHSAMLWFLSDLVSLATNDWFGYVNPEPLIPADKLQGLADGMARTTMHAFDPVDVADTSTRLAGELLGGLGWYGTHAGSAQLQSMTADYANSLADAVESQTSGGTVENGTANLAATQGIVGQGLLWASEVDGVDRTGFADQVLSYLLEDLWDADAGTFATGTDDSTYRITARDAGDVTGGLNAADALLDTSRVREVFPTYFDQTFNVGGLQRAQRPQSVDEGREGQPPLSPNAGGDHGQAAVYNAAVEYADGEWTVVDDRFKTAEALYLANQDVWIGRWAGQPYEGRGVPGRTDSP
ncbi:plasmid stabilization protein [Halobacteriales archaeon Cl-PHB]